MTLHLIQKSPFSSSVLKDCLNLINEDDCILLMQDGVYAQQDPALLALSNVTYIIEDDATARGIQSHNHTQCINYQDFVELCAKSDNVISWY